MDRIENNIDNGDVLDISVCILSYKRPKYLYEAITSVLNQTKRPKEFTIFDNCSGKEIELIVNSFNNKSIILEKSNENMGAPWNFKRAVNSAKGKYLLIMHDDDRLCSNFIEEQVNYLEMFQKYVAITCEVEHIDEVGRTIDNLKVNNLINNIKSFDSSMDVASSYLNRNYLNFPSVVYRTNTIKKLKLKDEYGKVSDVVLLCNLADIGPIYYNNKILYQYRQHVDQDSNYLPTSEIMKLTEFYFSVLHNDKKNNDAFIKDLLRESTHMRMRLINEKYKKDRSFFTMLRHIGTINLDHFSLIEAIKILLGH